MTYRISTPISVLLSGLVLPSSFKVGLPQAAQYVACPTTLPLLALSACERSAMHYAPCARMRVFSFLSLRENKLIKVGK